MYLIGLGFFIEDSILLELVKDIVFLIVVRDIQGIGLEL